jgi:hypothetical protein
MTPSNTRYVVIRDAILNPRAILGPRENDESVTAGQARAVVAALNADRGAVPQDDYDRVSRALDQRNIEVERLKNTLDTAHRDWRRDVDALRQQLRTAEEIEKDRRDDE